MSSKGFSDKLFCCSLMRWIAMRFERHGGSPDLQEAFRRFVLTKLRGRSLDDDKDAEAKQGKFPDFACFRDIVLFEMKHLETPQKERLNETYRKVVKPEEHPVFFGSRHIDFSRFSNGKEIQAKIAERLAKTLETLLCKAEDQFSDYRSRHPRKNSICICVILNSSLQEFSPDLVMYSVHRKMRSTNGPRFPSIDCVVYISEKHAMILPDGRVAHAICNFINYGALESRWKQQVVDIVLHEWSMFRTGSGATSAPTGVKGFGDVQDIPEKMPRHEAWRLAYRRNPYLRNLTDHQLKLHFTRCVALNSIGFVKGDWVPPSKDEMHQRMQRFTEALEEINHRGMDMREFSPKLLTEQELRQAYVGVPDELLQMILQGRERSD